MENNTKFKGIHLIQNSVSSNLTDSVEPSVKNIRIFWDVSNRSLRNSFSNMYFFSYFNVNHRKWNCWNLWFQNAVWVIVSRAFSLQKWYISIFSYNVSIIHWCIFYLWFSSCSLETCFALFFWCLCSRGCL